MVKDYWETHKRHFSIQYAFALFCNVIPHQTCRRFSHFCLFDRLVSTHFKSFLYYRLFDSLSFPRILSQTRFLCDCARSTHSRVLFIPLLICFSFFLLSHVLELSQFIFSHRSDSFYPENEGRRENVFGRSANHKYEKAVF